MRGRGRASHREALLLVGAGGLLGLCFFHLLPELSEFATSLHWIILGASVAVSAAFHLGHKHAHPHEDSSHHLEAHEGGVTIWNAEMLILFSSILLHAFADGLLLGLGQNFPGQFEQELFSLVAGHKLFEAFFVSSVALKLLPARNFWRFLVIYILALPVALLFTYLVSHATGFEPRVLQSLAMVFVSFALGSLVGCLLWDLVWPSVVRSPNRARASGYLCAGLVLAFALSRLLRHGG
jgi:hypothetical protein